MLQVTGLRKAFGGVVALAGVDFQVPAQSIIGVLGMNGSGKTTLLNCIGGIYRPDGGRINWRGNDIAGMPPHRVFQRGIGRTFQVPRLFPRMTVLENMAASQINANLFDSEIRARSQEWLERVDLWRLRHNLAAELSGGQQKLVELARVMVSGPQLILLDEPFAGVNPSLALMLIDLIREMPARDACSVVLVSHDLTSVYSLSSHIVVMHEGAVLASGDADAIRGNEAVIEAYLGA